MFNKRWKKVLAWSLSVVVVLAIGGLFAANYAVDKLMTSMAGGLDLESNNVSNSGSVIVEPTIAPAETVKPTEAIADNPFNNTNTPTVSAPASETATSQPVTAQKTAENSGNIASPSAKPQASRSPSSDKNTDVGGYSAQVSADKAKQIQENVTVKEKADVASIVMGQLSVSDIKRLQELASGGLTIDEKREARSIILGKVSEEQYNELSQIAKKYGVSEGKTQEQVLAEEEQSKAQEEGSEQQ
ncbi:hypothetical protein [Paenibacillus tianjinensis]|uniref:Uncharacterized protein n=1 Tax=Paenibacillus tianjinensis TaxID=2810347 RepID=A0ABX7L9R0_9BACL|nr:hypothetical protein [Paenibacillus tianjinensis]QSF44118.1 hypothetical protein JRJ22_23295 [Paenibacillus tianjinensis]